jgi:hypothetical protein
VYAREVNNQELTFGVSGKLIRNVLVMYDRQTESLWSQLLGESVSGELQGTKLEFLPSWHMTWEQWKEKHPDTLALKKGRRGIRDPYTTYYQSGATGIIPETFKDDRLPAKEFIVGVELDGAAIAYPFRVLSAQPVVNDEVGGHAILVVFDQAGAGSAVFDRQLGDQTLIFSAADSDNQTLKDNETGSTWDGLSGKATAGPLKGQSLTRLKSTSSFWFGWKDFHRNTEVFDPNSD